MEPEALLPTDSKPLPLSKNQQKKLKRDQEWEANRAARKAKRKEKVQEKKQRRRMARQAEESTSIPKVLSSPATQPSQENERAKRPQRPRYVQVPITLVVDCAFDDLMNEHELKSLGSQVTRCYSDNHKAPYQTHLVVSSFGGHLKERFEGLLEGHHRSWKNVRFLDEDFMEAADQARIWMRGERGGRVAGTLKDRNDSKKQSDQDHVGDIVYLTSDSPDTLTELHPFSTYVIGGLVDRNRHKGICYKKAMDRGIRTAKLPIGDYMQMTSRFVLATNHVAEIMLRWLEIGDWGKAFLQVVPKRKGGVLKESITVVDKRLVSEPSDNNVNEADQSQGEYDVKSSVSVDPRNFESQELIGNNIQDKTSNPTGGGQTEP